MPSLMELTDQVLALEKILMQSNGEINPELERFLDQVKIQLTHKVDNYDFIVFSLLSRAEFLDSKAGELWAAAKRVTQFVNSLRDNMKIAMLDMQVSELQGQMKRVVLTRGQKKLVLQEDMIPEDYKITVTSSVPDKEKIKAALVAGKDVAGARLEDTIQLRTYINAKG